MFERIVMVTTVSEARFREVARLLVDEGAAPAWFVSLEHVAWAETTKELGLLPSTDPSRVLLVDCSEHGVRPEPRRPLIGIRRFEPSPYQSDNELDRVLEELARQALEQVVK